MGYDISPLTVLEEKERMLSAAVEEEAVLVLEHDPVTACTSVEEIDGKIVAK
jgi:hypothetical protein